MDNPESAVAIHNLVYGNRTGILADGSGASVVNNEVHDNSQYGIEVDDGAVAQGNEVYGHTNVAIFMSSASARGNTVYDNELVSPRPNLPVIT